MILSKENYAVQREPIRLWLKNKSNCVLREEISSIAVSTGCPIIIVVEFAMEILGRTEELINIQNNLMKFYKVTGIV